MINRKQISKFPFHPFLFAIFPFLTYIAYNQSQVQVWEIWRILTGSLFGTLVLFLIIRLWVKSLQKTALIVTLLILAFYSFWHIYSLFLESPFFSHSLGRADVFAAIWAVICIVGPWWIWRKVNRAEDVNYFLSVVSVIAIILPSFSFLQLIGSQNKVDLPEKLPRSALSASDAPLPDIYYIILDGYGREDFLRDYYGYDNQQFIKFLETNDFIVADQGRANYNQTALSIASSLNLQYINEIAGQVGRDSGGRQPLALLIRDNQVRSILEETGYQFIAFSTGYSPTEIRDADQYLDLSPILYRLEKEYLSTTAAVLWLDWATPVWYREEILKTFSMLGEIPKQKSPKFVFAHILMPHPPFAFGPNGEELPITGFKDGSDFNGTKEEYIQGYKGQITFLNRMMEETISQILANSTTSPIIILQGDHGPGAYLNWQTEYQDCFKERISILNAYYLPDQSDNHIYSSITPVNTFRKIFNIYFNTDYPLLDDRSFFSKWDTPYEFVDITESADLCKIPAYMENDQ